VQQQSAATAPTGTDLRRPEKTSDLRQRPLMTPVRLVHTEEVTCHPARPTRSLSALCTPLAPQDLVFAAIGPSHGCDDQGSPEP
jgi:hypothetical protein